MTTFNTLTETMAAIPDEDAAVAHFTAIRWKDGAFCPYCQARKVYTFKDGRTHKCAAKACGKRFSIKVGTIFEGTKLPLRTWLLAIRILTSYKKGIASTTLARDLGITQKSAWFVLHRLREAATTKSFNAPLEGVVEADETFVGGKAKNKHASKRTGKRGAADKEAVFGMVQRDGELRMRPVRDLKARSLQATIREHVKPGSTIMTDDATAFVGLQGSYSHHAVNHSAGEYVRHFIIHTNTIEGAWSQLKRQTIGVHHFVSSKHLARYVGESEWRYNRRKMGEGNRADALIVGAAGRLTYKALIA